MKIDFNPQFTRSVELFEKTGDSVFITGMAGTGKSTIIDYLRKTNKKKTVFLASTGVAAVNICGQTLHSFFRFRPDITLASVKEIKVNRAARKMYREMETVVIDEISMVRADVLDCVNAFLRIYGRDRERSFGGVQMIFVGDLYQLPPVTRQEEESIFNGDVYESRYFFHSNAYKQSNFRIINLEKVYRQKDPDFIEVLRKIRDNTAGEQEINFLNSNCRREPHTANNNLHIYLAPTNNMVNRINSEKLNELNGLSRSYSGEITGKFNDSHLPTAKELKLKTGAQVMLLNNDSEKRWVNGSVGKVADIVSNAGEDIILVELSDGKTVDVLPYTWDVFRFSFDNNSNTIKSEKTGSFRQYPLKLAWAVTIHKSQGKTFKNVVIDVGNGTFDYGQMYVALSRCPTVDGIVLKTPIRREHIMADGKVKRFLEMGTLHIIDSQ